MNSRETLYGVSVATALLGKTDEKEISEYLESCEADDILIIKELQNIVLDFELSKEAASKKIIDVFKKYNL